MAYWIIGVFSVVMSIGVVIELIVNYRRGWDEEPESEDELSEVATQEGTENAVSRSIQHDAGKNGDESVDPNETRTNAQQPQVAASAGP